MFDSTKARVTGGKADAEMAKYVADKKQADRKIAEGRRDSQGKRAKAQSAWKSKSSAFREAMRQGRAVQKALKDGTALPPMDATPSEPDPSLVPCPKCGRTFNETAAARHIPRCKGSNPTRRPGARRR